MELWYLGIVTVCISLLIKAFLVIFITAGTHSAPLPGTAAKKLEKEQHSHTLPPGPSIIPLIGDLYWLRKTPLQFESILRSFRYKFGPIVCFRFISQPTIYILSRSVAQQAFVQNGALFASRPAQRRLDRIVTNYQHNITSSQYGPSWRLLRRNLTSQILHPSRIKSYSHARKWVLDVLVNRLQSDGGAGSVVKVMDHFRYAMFCLLVLMCFGDKLDENQINEIERTMQEYLLNMYRFTLLNFWPMLTKILFRRLWNELNDIVKRRQDVLVPLIKARRKGSKNETAKDHRVLAYVDTLLELELEDDETNLDATKKQSEKNRISRRLSEEDIIPLCSEFLNASTDTTSTALEWIMANLVKYPDIQDTLLEDMKDVVGKASEEVREEDLSKIPYLKAVILEGLRLHPPGHYVLPHAVTQEVEFQGYRIPKDASINVLITDIGRDPEAWDDPMMFKPERFLKKTSDHEGIELDSKFDITGSRGEIKMMPFGVGRRICPGLNLALLHLEYFVANLVWKFKWTAVDHVDMSERPQFTVVMKNPLHVKISPRF